MAYQNYRDCLFKISGQEIYVNDISVDTSADIIPVYKHGSKRNDYVNANSPRKTSISLNYYLTGVDPIKTYIDNPISSLSGDFAGFYFSSGYVSSYSLRVTPNSPVAVNTTIDVFQDLNGSFSAQSSGSVNPKLLNYVNATLLQMTSDYSSEDFSYADQINFDYSINLIPEYAHCTGDAGQHPYRVVTNEKTLSMTVSCDNTKMSLPITGDQAGLRLQIRDKSYNTVDEYSCSGHVTSRRIQTSVGEELRSEYTINQWNTSLKPIISGYNTSSHTPNGSIAFYGANFDTIISAKIGDYYLKNLRYVNNNVTGQIPSEAISGDLYISTEWGEYKSPTPIPNWTYPNISISSISPTRTHAGNNVIISGDNFYDISSVKFYNNVSSNFRVLTSKAIEATVPDTAIIGAITVASSKRNKSASSSSFTPYPKITSLSSYSAAVGAGLTINGTNFSNVSDVQFNAESASYTVVSPTVITVTVPNGNNAGSVKVITSYGYTAYSPAQFYPTLDISNVTKPRSTITEGEQITLTLNQSVNSAMLYESSTSKYAVQFGNNVRGEFTLATATTLVGNVPVGATTGKVHVVRTDGASVYGNGYWLNVDPKPPIITEIFPKLIQKTGNTSINFTIKGHRLKNIQNIFLFGDNEEGLSDSKYTNEDGTVSSTKITFTTSDFVEDIYGKTLIAKSNTLMASADIGYYNVVVSGVYLGAGFDPLKDTAVKGVAII